MYSNPLFGRYRAISNTPEIYKVNQAALDAIDKGLNTVRVEVRLNKDQLQYLRDFGFTVKEHPISGYIITF